MIQRERVELFDQGWEQRSVRRRGTCKANLPLPFRDARLGHDDLALADAITAAVQRVVCVMGNFIVQTGP